MKDRVRVSSLEEREQANQQLTDAIQHCIDVHFGDGYSVGDFVIATAVQFLNEQGHLVTEHPMLFRDGDIPWYRVLGLLQIAEGTAKMSLIEGEDNG